VERVANGGFPEPAAGERVRTVRCRHDSCGAETSVRLPAAVFAEAVRRVVCERCGAAFEPGREAVVDLGVGDARAAAPAVAPQPAPPGRPARRWLSDPESPAWRYLSIPIAAALVIVALIVIQRLT